MEDCFEFTYIRNITTSTSDIYTVSKVSKEEYRNMLLEDICNATWQGVIMNQPVNDNDLIRENCFMWCNKWKNCPVSVINDVPVYLFTNCAHIDFRGSK